MHQLWLMDEIPSCIGHHHVQGGVQGGCRTLPPPWQRPHIQVASGRGVSTTVVALALRRPRGLGTGWSVRVDHWIVPKPTVDLVVLTLRP